MNTHYIALNFGEITEINYIDDSAITGINKRYKWKDIEPEEGVYDFSEIEKDLAYLRSKNKQLVVFFMDKSYSRNGALPDYLSDYEIKVSESEYGVPRWKPKFVERFISLGIFWCTKL